MRSPFASTRVGVLFTPRLWPRSRFLATGLAQPLFGDVAVVRRLVDLAEEDVRSVGVGVNDARAAGGAETHFVETERSRLHALHLHAAAELLFDDAADLRLVGRRIGRRKAK